jgi:hypothetical protein
MDPPAMAVLVKAMRAMLNRGMRIKFVLKDVGFILNLAFGIWPFGFCLKVFIILLNLGLSSFVKCGIVLKGVQIYCINL